jgi:hypothetical protein
MVEHIKKAYPLAQQYLEKVYVFFVVSNMNGADAISREVFDENDTDHDNVLTLNEAVAAFQKLQSKITSYPAVRAWQSWEMRLKTDDQTAQVASQQGKYLGKMYGKLADQHKVLDANEMPDHDDELYYKPFKYMHLGTLAYIGNS